MENIINIFEQHLNTELKEIIISNSLDKDKILKIKIRPVIIKGELQFQSESYKGKQVFHNNYTRKEVIENIPQWFDILKQAELMSLKKESRILISKKGKTSVKTRNKSEECIDKLDISLSHNRKKKYLLEEGKVIPFLVDLGVMTKEGAIVRSMYDKYRQINRFLEFIEDITVHLDKQEQISIIDFGCGKSYLTFAMYYYLKEVKGYEILITGLDLKEDVIENCNILAKRYEFENLKFQVGDIASYNDQNSVHMVVTLHACDTATDYALYKAVKWGAKVILSVPCCQHELNSQINCEPMESILKYGLIKERSAALFTDALRANVLETQGYKVQVMEFIDTTHTPKNILIRAIKSENHSKQKDPKYKECLQFLGVNPTLSRLFEEEGQ